MDCFLEENYPVPTYLQNIEIDNKLMERVKKPKPTGLHIADFEKQFSIRLARHRQKARERKQKMINRRKELERSHREFLKSLRSLRGFNEETMEKTIASRESPKGTPKSDKTKASTAETRERTSTPGKSPATKVNREKYYFEE